MMIDFFLQKMPSWWTRVCAKLIDYSLFYLATTIASLFLPFYIDEIYYLLYAFVIPLLWMPVEALLLSKWGTTVGKKIFGIHVVNHMGGKLPFWIALKRASCLGIRPGVIRQAVVKPARLILGLGMSILLLLGAVFEKEVTEFTTGFEKYKTADGWQAYTSKEGGFKVLLPNDPQQESHELPIPSQNKILNYNELTSYQTQKVYYSVSYMELPRKWKLAGSSRLLQGSLDVIVEHTPGAELLHKHFTKHQSHRALDFHFKQGDEEVQGRLILVGTTLFRLTVSYPPSLAHQLQQDEFINSFEVQG